MKANGKKRNSMDKELRRGTKANAYTKVHSRMARRQEKHVMSKMVTFMKVISLMASFMVRVNTPLQKQERFTKEISKIIKWSARGPCRCQVRLSSEFEHPNIYCKSG